MSEASPLAIAQQVEELSGPNRDIDRAIAPIVCIRVVDEGHPLGTCYYDENHHGVPLPKFTGSVDAAATLVPAPGKWSVTAGHKGGWQACVWIEGAGFLDWRSAATPALALCAAALRARVEAP
jgi:hypothetical protein